MRRLRIPAQVVSVLVLALLLAVAGPAVAGDSKPRVVPIDEEAYGKTYGEWSAAWWQWVISMGMTDHPVLDGTGHPDFDLPGFNCDAGQQGKVWFLAGNFGGNATRKCTVPNGKALLIPILNAAFDNVGPPLRNPPVGEAALRNDCLNVIADPEKLAVKIDGKSLQNLDDFAVEPTLFSYTVPDVSDNIYRAFGFEYVGEVLPPGAVSCGYYVLLQPLSKGKHHITIEAANADESFSLKVEYDLTVSKSRAKGK